MLTTATILMPLGTDPMNGRHPLFNQTGAANVSFAKSFDESSALAGEMTQTADGSGQKDTAEAESALSLKNQDVPGALSRLKVKGNVRAGDGLLQNEPHRIKSQAQPVSSEEVASISVGGRATSTHSGRSKENTSRSVQAKVPGDQISVEDVKNADQKSAAEEIDGAKTDATDGMTSSRTDAAVSPMPPIPDNGEKQMIQNQKEMPVAEKDQETASTKTVVAKGHDGVGKIEKTGDKSKKTIETAGNVVDIEAKTIVAVSVMVLPVTGQSHKLNAAPDDAPLSGASAVAGRSVGMVATTDSKVAKQSMSAAKTDGDRAKMATSTLVDDPALKKVEIVETKTAPSAVKTTDENAKVQNPVEAVIATGLTHIGQGMPGVPIGGIAGGSTAHVITATSQMTGTGSHAAISQADSGMIDTMGQTDVTHKTLMATPTTLEVGVANGTHGWLKIRAEMTGDGAVNASLSTASSSGQEMLHRELPSLAAYLQSERVAVNTVVVQTTVAAGPDSHGLAGKMNSDGREQAPQSGSQGGENRQGTVSTAVNRAEKDVLYNSLSEVQGDELLSSALYAGGGSWLSVRV